jgi:hypothetical protein
MVVSSHIPQSYLNTFCLTLDKTGRIDRQENMSAPASHDDLPASFFFGISFITVPSNIYSHQYG